MAGVGKIENLKPFNEMSEEERKERGRKGGINSGKTRKEKRSFRMLLEMAMSQKVRNKEGDEKTKKEVSIIQLADKCMRGDLRAIELAMNILGENPVNKVEVTGKDGQDLIPAKRLTKEEAKELMSSMDSEY